MNSFSTEPAKCSSRRWRARSRPSWSGTSISETTGGRRVVVRNGYLPERQILTGAGAIAVHQPRVRDKRDDGSEKIKFSSAILPPYLRRSKAIDELIPWLYLKGVSTGDFSEALEALVGPQAKGLSAGVVVKLKEQWQEELAAWQERDLSEKQYVYFWADGIYFNIRLEDDRQCISITRALRCQS
ncbi:MAG: transposase [Pirellulales bacterium]